MSYTSRIPAITAVLAAKVDAAVKEAADQIAEDAKTRVPVRTGELRDAIHTERIGISNYAVVAGRKAAFYGHIVEHGGNRTAPRPFLVPAAEDNRATFTSLVAAALRDL